MTSHSHKRRAVSVLAFLALGCAFGGVVLWNGFQLVSDRDAVFRHVTWAVPVLWLTAVPVLWFALFARLSGLKAGSLLAQSLALCVVVVLVPMTGMLATMGVLAPWLHGISACVMVAGTLLWLWRQALRTRQWFSS